MLAESGFVVRALGTTGTESGIHMEPLACLRGLGSEVHIAAGRTGNRIRPELGFTCRGIRYRLLDIGRRPLAQWEQTCGRQFDLAFDDERNRFQPTFSSPMADRPGIIKLSRAELADWRMRLPRIPADLPSWRPAGPKM
jgi:hypothetical protein